MMKKTMMKLMMEWKMEMNHYCCDRCQMDHRRSYVEDIERFRHYRGGNGEIGVVEGKGGTRMKRKMAWGV